MGAGGGREGDHIGVSKGKGRGGVGYERGRI